MGYFLRCYWPAVSGCIRQRCPAESRRNEHSILSEFGFCSRMGVGVADVEAIDSAGSAPGTSSWRFNGQDATLKGWRYTSGG